jgi:Flp pilus assembly protein TadG
MKLTKFRKGQMAIVMTLVIATLLGVMALGTDVGVLYYNWGKMQKTADAAALAGALYLGPWSSTTTPALANPTIANGCPSSFASGVACSYAITNDAKLSEVTVNSPALAPTGANAQTIQVVVNRSIPSFFARVLGLTSFPVVAAASAQAPVPATGAKEVFPVGMSPQPGGASMVYGKTYNLTGDQAPGNWGWLDLPQNCTGTGCYAKNKGGAPNLATNITNGCTCTLSKGNEVASAPGISWGPVNSAMSSVVTNPGETIPSKLTGTESQLVLVPIVSGWVGGNGVTTLTIQGFAEMWIVSYAKSGSDVTINAQFVQYMSDKVTAGDPNATNFGALKMPYLIN